MSGNLEEDFVALQEFVVQAREKLGNNEWGYIVGGAETETSQRRNRQAIEKLALRPRVLNDVSKVDCSGMLLGKRVALPVLLCPIGGLESFDPDGAVSLARAAGTFGVHMMLSSVSRRPIDEVTAVLAMAAKTAAKTAAKKSGDAIHESSAIMQLYAREDAAGVDAVVDQCIALGSGSFCITVDSAVYSRRERDIVARYKKSWRATGEGDAAHYQAALSWKDIERIRKRFPGKLVLKGIATAEDTQLALDAGVDSIYVSNHGGRQLDHTLGTLAMLPPIVNTVRQSGTEASVLVDGGFCRGTDIIKALALGADGVGLGRMMCLALAAAGSDGVVRMLELLRTEFAASLALLGVTSIDDINASHVTACDELHFEHSLSAAFPLLTDFNYN